MPTWAVKLLFAGCLVVSVSLDFLMETTEISITSTTHNKSGKWLQCLVSHSEYHHIYDKWLSICTILATSKYIFRFLNGFLSYLSSSRCSELFWKLFILFTTKSQNKNIQHGESSVPLHVCQTQLTVCLGLSFCADKYVFSCLTDWSLQARRQSEPEVVGRIMTFKGS